MSTRRKASDDYAFNYRLVLELGIKNDIFAANGNGDVYNFGLLCQTNKERVREMEKKFTPKQISDVVKAYIESSHEIVSLPCYENGGRDVIEAAKILQQEIRPNTRNCLDNECSVLLERTYLKEMDKFFSPEEMEWANRQVPQLELISIPDDSFDAVKNSRKIVNPNLQMMYNYKMNREFTSEELKVAEFCEDAGIRF